MYNQSVDCSGLEPCPGVGGCIMEWVDEWWKGNGRCGPGGIGPSNGYCGRYCPDSNPEFHGPCGGKKADFPDGWMNEEWWGLLSIDPPCPGTESFAPDRLTPREAFLRVS